jgi:hypothetical protein
MEEFDAVARFTAEAPQPVYIDPDGGPRVPSTYERLTSQVFHKFSDLIIRYGSNDGKRVVEAIGLPSDDITDLTAVTRSFLVPTSGVIRVLGAHYEHAPSNVERKGFANILSRSDGSLATARLEQSHRVRPSSTFEKQMLRRNLWLLATK